ncbi:MAG: hypothetical protein Q7S08_04330 [bacterium]|nr:hypothetical protein [bacterium]
MKKDARYYFANLGADVMRCILASESQDNQRYESSLVRARKTLGAMRSTHRPEAYEEGLLLMRAMEYARVSGHTQKLKDNLNSLIAPYLKH